LLCIASRLWPVVLLLDDVHWADRPTLLMLRHVLRSSQQTRICLVATYREMELDRTHPLADVLSDIRRSDAVNRVSLGGVSADHVHRFIHAWTGQVAVEGLTKLVFENTEGNPFFISEVLRHLSETGTLDRLKSRQYKAAQDLGLPEGVKEAIGRR